MWDEIQIQCSDAYEIAEALINNEVNLTQLKSVPAFLPKADLTEEAVWDLCNSRKEYQRYLDIYPNGTHGPEVDGLLRREALEREEQKWQAALQRNDMGGYLEYRSSYPQGTHIREVDDKVWGVAQQNGSYSAYLANFPNGKHADEARIKQAEKAMEEEDWQLAKSIDTPESYKGYVDSYPQGLHTAEANHRMAELMAGQKENIIRDLMEDRNAYGLNYIKACGITAADLRGKIKDSKGQLRDEVLKSWNKTPINLSMGVTPTEIPEGSTEVYFWGVPGSGKTCAMAAILSRARQMSCYEPRIAEGTGYMNDLSSMFISDPGTPAICLPLGSKVDTTQYLPLTLNEKVLDKKGRETIKQHDLSVIEISGEIFECFTCEVEGKPFKTEQHKATYKQLKKYLESKHNPKYHFFVLDSQPAKAEQIRHLQNAATYFKKNGIFNSTTQGISLIVTKSDVLSPDRNAWVQCAEDAAKKHFGALVSQLKVIMGQSGLGLNDGSLQVIPLSIGEVFFKSLCLFDEAPATTLVNLLIEYSKVAETDGWIDKTKGFFRK